MDWPRQSVGTWGMLCGGRGLRAEVRGLKRQVGGWHRVCRALRRAPGAQELGRRGEADPRLGRATAGKPNEGAQEGRGLPLTHAEETTRKQDRRWEEEWERSEAGG